MNVTATEIPRRGRLKYGLSQFSEGWPLVYTPAGADDPEPWTFPGIDPHLERWPSSRVVEPAVQGNSDETRAFLDSCYSRGLEVSVEHNLGLHNIAVWRVTCPNHRYDHVQHGHRYLDVWVSTPNGAIDAIELVDPEQADDALARVRLDEAAVATWLDVIRHEVN